MDFLGETNISQFNANPATKKEQVCILSPMPPLAAQVEMKNAAFAFFLCET